MKVNINKLQTGGGFATFTPIINANPGATTTKTAAGTQAAQTSSILDDDTFKELLTKGGLTNDVNSLVSELVKLESTSATPFAQTNNRSMALRMISKVNEIRQNHELWKNAIGQAKESGGLGEVAVDNNQMFTKDEKGKIKTISIAEYAESSEKVRVLTVSELMQERQYNPQLANQNSIFGVAGNAVGLNKITDHIKGLVHALGKEENEDTRFYSKDQASQFLASMGSKKPSDEEAYALKTLQQVISSPTDYSQVTTKISTQKDKNQINTALGYIWRTLGTNAQQKLAATAAVNGVSDPRKFILDMLETETFESRENKVIPHGIPGESAGTSGSKGKGISLSPSEMFHMDKLYAPNTKYTINNPAAGVSIDMVATGIGPLYGLNKDGNVIEPAIVTNIMSKGNYQALLDQRKAFIGDSRIDPSQLGEMVYSGDDVAKIYMPVKGDGSPDLAGMTRFQEVYKVYQVNKDKWSVQQAESFFARNDFRGVKIQEIKGLDGSINKEIIENNSVRPFLALPILTNSASTISDNPWMVKLTGNSQASAENIMNTAFTIFGGTASKPTSKNMAPSGYFSLEKPYKGTLFIAYRPEASAVLSSMHSHLVGTAPTELDVHRNLWESTNTGEAANLNGGASVLVNK